MTALIAKEAGQPLLAAQATKYAASIRAPVGSEASAAVSTSVNGRSSIASVLDPPFAPPTQVCGCRERRPRGSARISCALAHAHVAQENGLTSFFLFLSTALVLAAVGANRQSAASAVLHVKLLGEASDREAVFICVAVIDVVEIDKDVVVRRLRALRRRTAHSRRAAQKAVRVGFAVGAQQRLALVTKVAAGASEAAQGSQARAVRVGGDEEALNLSHHIRRQVGERRHMVHANAALKGQLGDRFERISNAKCAGGQGPR